MQVQPYLFFDGRCEEALEFYKKAIGAKVDTLMRWKDSPDKSMATPANADKVMHASFQIGDTTVMASDGRNEGKPNFHGFALSIAARNEAEADKMFAALGEGGQVTMPMTKTFFSVFKNSRIKHVSRYGKAGREVHGKEAGSVMVVEFEIDGQSFTALNGGPHFKFNEAVSFQVSCATQAEIDHFWSRLSQGGQESRCGWLKDKYGVSWQIVPSVLPQMMASADGATADRVMNAVLKMKKFDLDVLNRAYAGQG